MQQAGTGNVGKSGCEVCGRELGLRTERTQIPHGRSRQSWEEHRTRRAEGDERARGERKGRSRGEAPRATRRLAYAPEAAMLQGAAHMPGSLRVWGLVPGARAGGVPSVLWAEGGAGSA